MLAAVGPYALEHSLVDAAPDGADSALVRIHNTNTGKIIHATFPVAGPRAADLSGEFGIDGVAGTHARITLDFVSPEGSRTGKLFPTGERAEELQLPNGSVRTTLMDCGNPCVFVRAEDLGVDPYALPAELEAHDGGKTLARLNDIRNAAAVRMGLVDSLDAAAKAKSVPKVCVMSPKADHKVLSGATLRADDTDVVTRCISSGDPHRALPITASLCAAAAAQIEGTVVHDCLSGPRVSQGVIIGHASGTIEVDADVAVGDNGKLRVPKARVFRTARKLFEGNVFF
jgi:2-methylaconitate cis-trans-isomerase PrpF